MLSGDEGYRHILIRRTYLWKVTTPRSAPNQRILNCYTCRYFITHFLRRSRFFFLTCCQSGYSSTRGNGFSRFSTLTRLSLCAWVCQGNIRGAVLRPRTTKNFPASFNFIMKAWTATNSQIGTKAHLRAASLYTTSSNLPLGPFPFKRTRVCMKTNVCGSTTHPLHSPAGAWAGLGAMCL